MKLNARVVLAPIGQLETADKREPVCNKDHIKMLKSNVYYA